MPHGKTAGTSNGAALIAAATLILSLWAAPPVPADPGPVSPGPVSPERGWTLGQLTAQALAHSPALRARDSATAALRGEADQAAVYPHNPELAVDLGDRRRSGAAEGESFTDWSLAVSQQLDLAGRRRHRRRAAGADLAAGEAARVRSRQLLAAEVATAFARAVRARELLRTAEIDAELAREILDYSRRRLEAGAGTQIEVNLAEASAGRAAHAVRRAETAYSGARARLAELAALDPLDPPEPSAELTLAAGEPAALDELLAEARAGRSDLGALADRELAARFRIGSARAEGRSRFSLGAFFAREEGDTDIVGATFAIGLPLFDRNLGGVAAAQARAAGAAHERDAAWLAVAREVTVAAADLSASRRAAEELSRQVVSQLEDSLRLLRRSFEAGRIGATDVVTLRRELIEGRREQIEALTEARLARIALDLALGRPPAPTPEETSR